MLHIHEPIFMFDLFFCYKNETQKQLVDFITKNKSFVLSKKEITDLVKDALTDLKQAKYYSLKSRTCIIYYNNFKDRSIDYGCITHETLHLVHDVLQYAVVTLTDSSEEVYAYLTGFINTQIFNHIFLEANK